MPPFVRRKVLTGREESRTLFIILSQNDTFEVMEDVSQRTVVDLRANHCDGREYDVFGVLVHMHCDALIQ